MSSRNLKPETFYLDPETGACKPGKEWNLLILELQINPVDFLECSVQPDDYGRPVIAIDPYTDEYLRYQKRIKRD